MVRMHLFIIDGSTKNPCIGCSGNHSAKVSQFIHNECFYSKNKGHIAKVCGKKARSESKADPHQTHLIKKEERSLQSDKDLHIFQVSKPKPTPLFKVEIFISETPVQMVTGASISLINLNTCNDVKADKNEAKFSINDFFSKCDQIR